MTISNLPLVTVVIPSYNHASYVKESIQSIVDQDYSNIELIIIDDGSKDNSIDVINEMVAICQKRFTRFEFRHRPNKGLCATLNEALDWSKGEYFSPFASDDIALPHKISFLVSKIIDTDYSAVFGTVRCIGDSHESFNFQSEEVEHTFEKVIMQKELPYAPTALVRTSDIEAIGGYPEDIQIEDWYMWLKLTETGKRLVSFNKVISLYRKHSHNTVNNIDAMYQAKEDIINLFSDHIIYDQAYKNNLLVKAQSIAYEKTIEPISLLWQAKSLNKQGLNILIKALLPKSFIDFKRKVQA